MYTNSGMPIYDVDVVLGCKEQLLHQKTAVASSSDAHFCFGNAAAIGGVELTRLLMTCMKASGRVSATASTKSFTMLTLMLRRSSRVIPGFLGTLSQTAFRLHH